MAAIHYAALDKAEVWQMLPEATANPADWADFVAATKKLYPRCKGANRYCHADIQYLIGDYRTKAMHSQDDLGEYTRKFTKFAAILIANRKLSETEYDIMFLAGFPTPLQDCVHHRLAIVKPDVHLDDPYPMDNIIAAAKFLLTGSTFRSTIPPVANAPQPNMHHLTPYHPFQGSAQPIVPVPSFNLPPALKTEANIAACTALLCNWCADLGHFTHNCQDAHEWINTGRVIHGTDSRLYMPDGPNILCAPGGQCLRDSVEYAMTLQQSGQQLAQQPAQQSAKQSVQQPATTSTSASSGFTRDTLPHLTTGLLCSAFPEMPAILDIDLSAFLMTVMSTTDYPPMPIVEDVNFQPYIAQAWVAFKVDRVSKDKNKKCLHFDGVKIPPHKTPLDKAPNLELCRATVSEEMEVLSPELQ